MPDEKIEQDDAELEDQEDTELDDQDNAELEDQDNAELEDQDDAKSSAQVASKSATKIAAKPAAKTASKATAKKKKKGSNRVAKWFREMRSELKKVVWPTPKQVVNNTMIARSLMAISAVMIWALDQVGGQIFQAIRVLGGR
jgi:preprotein translocase subunit SecE